MAVAVVRSPSTTTVQPLSPRPDLSVSTLAPTPPTLRVPAIPPLATPPLSAFSSSDMIVSRARQVRSASRPKADFFDLDITYMVPTLSASSTFKVDDLFTESPNSADLVAPFNHNTHTSPLPILLSSHPCLSILNRIPPPPPADRTTSSDLSVPGTSSIDPPPIVPRHRPAQGPETTPSKRRSLLVVGSRFVSSPLTMAKSVVENARVKEARKQEAEARALEERQRQEELLTWWRSLCEKVTRWRAAILTDDVIGGSIMLHPYDIEHPLPPSSSLPSPSSLPADDASMHSWSPTSPHWIASPFPPEEEGTPTFTSISVTPPTASPSPASPSTRDFHTPSSCLSGGPAAARSPPICDTSRRGTPTTTPSSGGSHDLPDQKLFVPVAPPLILPDDGLDACLSAGERIVFDRLRRWYALDLGNSIDVNPPRFMADDSPGSDWLCVGGGQDADAEDIVVPNISLAVDVRGSTLLRRRDEESSSFVLRKRDIALCLNRRQAAQTTSQRQALEIPRWSPTSSDIVRQARLDQFGVIPHPLPTDPAPRPTAALAPSLGQRFKSLGVSAKKALISRRRSRPVSASAPAEFALNFSPPPQKEQNDDISPAGARKEDSRRLSSFTFSSIRSLTLRGRRKSTSPATSALARPFQVAAADDLSSVLVDLTPEPVIVLPPVPTVKFHIPGFSSSEPEPAAAESKPLASTSDPAALEGNTATTSASLLDLLLTRISTWRASLTPEDDEEWDVRAMPDIRERRFDQQLATQGWSREELRRAVGEMAHVKEIEIEREWELRAGVGGMMWGEVELGRGEFGPRRRFDARGARF